MSRLARALLVALALAASGCVTAQAKVEPGGPALDPPAPPPHTVIPVEIVEEPPAPAVPVLPAQDADRPPPVAKRQKSTDKSAEKPPDPAAAPPQPVTPPQAPPLQITANVTEVTNNIRKRMDEARRDLNKIDPGALSTERRTQFDTAKRFLEQAEDALKVNNLVFAEQLADKAATLAAALVQK
jgi:hypothetical protein